MLVINYDSNKFCTVIKDGVISFSNKDLLKDEMIYYFIDYKLGATTEKEASDLLYRVWEKDEFFMNLIVKEKGRVKMRGASVREIANLFKQAPQYKE